MIFSIFHCTCVFLQVALKGSALAQIRYQVAIVFGEVDIMEF